MRSPTVFAAILLSGTSTAFPAHSCSMTAGYKVPTTLELAASAESIVLARVGDALPAEEGDIFGKLTLTPETLVYGGALPEKLTLDGYLNGGRLIATNSDPNELSRANPDAFWGGCNRYVFRKGMLLLLFLARQKDGSLAIRNDSFARTLEDVPDESAPWVRAVRFYAEISRYPKDVRRRKMSAEHDRLQGTGDSVDALLAMDIERQISGKRTQNYD